MRYHAARAPQQRIMAIDLALRANQFPDDKVLARDLEVDPRTIRRDLKSMRNTLRAPIAFDPIRRGYSQQPRRDQTLGHVVGEGLRGRGTSRVA